MTTRAPALFIGHGSPRLTMSENAFTQGWAEIASRFEKPRAVICASAHWLTDGVAVTGNETQRTIHDFRGFPPALYEVRYEPPGAPQLAQNLVDRLGSVSARIDNDWGLDHGAWAVLRWMYPDADVPVIQLSLDRRRTPSKHRAIAKALAPLRDEGVAIIGSGNIVHNLPITFGQGSADYDWAHAFDEFVVARATAGDDEAIVNYKEHPAAAMAAPDWDHFFPVLYALGARETDERPIVFNKNVMSGMSMTSLAFGLPQ